MTRRRNFYGVLAIAAALAVTSGLPAQGSEEEQDRSYEGTVPDDYGPYVDVPLATYQLVTALDRDYTDTSFVWDSSVQRLTIWCSSAAEADAVRSVVAASAASGVDVAVSAYTRDQLSQAATEVVESRTFAGGEVSWAAPRPDGSGLDVGVNPTTAARSAAPEAYDGIPVTVVSDGEAVAASRDRDYSPFIAGADMIHRIDDQYVGYCTTAFAFNHFDVPTSTNVERMFTADHCVRNGESEWHTGRNLGYAQVGATVSAVTEQSDIGALGGQDYDPYVYWGANTSNSAVAVFGYVTPIVGASVCYSGAPSGTVCGNAVTHTDVDVAYGTWPNQLFYDGLTRTVQDAGISAAGNGDSGGPVVVIATGGYPYAAGIISGMSNAGDSCQGDPSTTTRKCSATLYFAPVADYFNLAANELDTIQTY